MFDPRSFKTARGKSEAHQTRTGISARHAPHSLPVETEAPVIGRIAKHDDCCPVLRPRPFESGLNHRGGNSPAAAVCRYGNRRQGKRSVRCA